MAAGLALGGLFLVLALRRTDLEAVQDVLGTVRPGAASVVPLMGLAFMLFKTLRWSVLMRPLVRPRFPDLYAATYIGTAANLIVMHSGELVRAVMVGRSGGVAPSAVLASVGLERVFDFLALLMMLGTLALFDSGLPQPLVTAGIVAVGIVLVAILALYALLRPTRWARSLSHWLLDVLPQPLRDWTVGQLRRSRAGLAVLGMSGAVAMALALSMLQWACIVAAVWFSVAAVGSLLPVAAAVGVVVLLVVGLTLPTAPAQLGTTQLAFTAGLTLAGHGAEQAFAASVVYTCGVVLPVVGIGALVWAVRRR